jgi:hypothetical protein
MKKLLLSSIVLMFFAVAANAQTAPSPATPSSSTTVEPDKKTEIKLEALPQPIKTTLSTDAYKGWAVVKVVYNETKDNYEVDAKNATETKTLTFDKEGKEIKS